MAKPGDPEKGKAAEEPQVEEAAKESKAAKAKADASAEEAPKAAAKPKAARKPRAKKAEATAAEQTGVGKDAAEAATKEGASEPVAEDKPKPARKPRAKKADAPAEEAKPAARPARVNGERATVRAQAKYVRTSARKARLVCDHIRGKDVLEARAILAHTPRSVAEAWTKLLESAVANAEHNHELLGDELKILSVTADEGPTLKRFRPRAMGRATKIRKRTSHLTITLTPKE
jgi:ribosomal protein L22